MEKMFKIIKGISVPLTIIAGSLFALLVILVYAFLDTPALLPVLMVLPVILVTFSTKGTAGIALSIISAAAWLLVDLLVHQPAAGIWKPIFNTLFGLLIFLGAVYLINEYKTVLKRESDCAHEDPLTGLPNLRGFFTEAEREITRAKRNKTPISLAYLGLDNLTRVIEEQGQKFADNLLRQLAHSLVSNTRGTDVSARIGGSDFILLMSDTGIDGGIKGIRRVNELLLQLIEEHEMPISFSIGLVTYNILPDSIDQMIAQASALKEENHPPGSDPISHQVVDL